MVNSIKRFLIAFILVSQFSPSFSIPFQSHYDVIILGVGTAGIRARDQAMACTDNFLVIDPGELGSTCARTGCIPSKALLQIAKDFSRQKAFAIQGINGAEKLSVDIPKALERVRELRDFFVNGMKTDCINPWLTPKHLYKGHARFINQNTLCVDGDPITADKIIIATGSSPKIPSLFNGFEDFLITTDTFFEQKDFPKNVAVVGLGFTGLEMSQAMSELGVNVFMIARRRSLGGISDPALLDYSIDFFTSHFNLSFDGTQRLEHQGNQVLIHSGDKTFLADQILVATGRKPNIESLQLENLHLPLNQNGLPDVDPQTFQLKGAPNIYLAGDVTNEKTVVHEARDEGQVSGKNSMGNPKAYQTRVPLEIIYTHPNICFVGKKYQQLINEKVDFIVGEKAFNVSRNRIKQETCGLLRMYADKKTGAVLGAEMIGFDAEYIAHLMAFAIDAKMTVRRMLTLPFYHPSSVDVIHRALKDALTKLGEPSGQVEIFPLH